MTTETIKEFLVGLGFKVDENQLGNFTQGITKATTAVTVLGTAVVGAAAGIFAFVNSVADDFDRIGDLSYRVNATSEEIIRLGYVATLAGSSVEAANASLENLSRIAGEAVVGVGRGALIFEQFGLEARKANGDVKTSAELLEEVGQKVKDLSRAEQTAIFSKLGIDPSLIQALTEDTSELKAEFDQLYKGLGIDANEAAAASGDFKDSVDKLAFAFDAVRKAIAIRFMGQVKNAFDTTRKVFVENAPKIVAAITPIIDLVLKLAEVFIILAGRLAQGVSFIIDIFQDVNRATDGMATYLLAAVAAWRFLNLAFLTSPIGIVLSLAAAIVLLVDDFLTFQEGGEAIIDWSGNFGDAIRGIIKLVSLLGDGLREVGKLMEKFDIGAGQIASFFANPVGSVAYGASAAIRNAFGGDNADISAPRGGQAASLNGATQNVSQKTEIVVQGTTDPQATARLVLGQQGRVNADLTRNLSGVTR